MMEYQKYFKNKYNLFKKVLLLIKVIKKNKRIN